MTSLAADRAPMTVATPGSGALRALAVLLTSFSRAVETARAYEEADTTAARRRVLEDFTSGRRAA